MYQDKSENQFELMARRLPDAIAVMRGDAAHENIEGTVKLYQTTRGVLVVAEMMGLPIASEPCQDNIFALHIHSGTSCTGNEQDAFADALTHYDPEGCPHPYHAGDLPPLFGAGDLAFLAVLTNRFALDEVIGKTLILHDRPDDFTSQPSGNAGGKIACGVITRVAR